MILHSEMDATRLALYPTLDYIGLYSALESLLHSASSINTGLQGKICIVISNCFTIFFFFKFKDGKKHNVTIKDNMKITKY